MRVAGLDLSLTGTGLAIFDTEEPPSGELFLISTKGTKKDTLEQRRSRLVGIVNDVIRRLSGVSLLVVESPSYGSMHGSQHDRSGLWWIAVDTISQCGIPVATVTPQGRAKYATGKGNAAKDAVLIAAVKAFPWLDIQDNNTADAAVLAAMGCRYLGEPIDDDVMTEAKLAAMDGAAWPT